MDKKEREHSNYEMKNTEAALMLCTELPQYGGAPQQYSYQPQPPV